LVALDARQELALGVGVPPSICLEPPAPDCLLQRSEVVTLPGLLEGGVQLGVVASQHACIGVGR